jgi:predicted exporter
MVSGRTSLVATFDTLYGDVVRVSIAAVLIVLVLLAVLFRGLRIAVVLLATVGLALLMTAAFAAVVFASVSLVSWVFIALIVGLGVDSGIHIAWHCTAQARTGADRAVAMAGALTRPGPAILLGGATSAAAFLALVAIPYPVTREIACLTAFGLIAAVACSLTVLPFMLSLTTRVQRTVRDGPRLLDRFARPRRRARPGDLFPWLVLVGAAAWVAPSIPFEAHPWQLVVRGNQDFARLDNLSTRMGWSLAPLRLVSTGRTPEEALDRDRLAVRRLQHVSLRAGVGIIESLSRWVPDAAEQGEIRHLLRELELTAPRVMGDATAALQQLDHVDPWLEEEYLPRIVTLLDPDTATIDLAHLARRGGDRLIARHLQRVDSGYLASSCVYLRRYPWADGVVPRFVEIAGAGGVLDVPGVTLDGRHLRADDHAPRIRRSLLLATLLAATLVGLTLRFRIRRWSLVALCLAPALCGLSAAVLVVWMLNLQLTLLTVIAGPVLLGIGIDDGIHMVDRLTRRQPLLTILREAGTAMSLTTLTTVGALAALALATFPGIRELGLVLGSGLLVCLLASFLLVPVGWRLLFGSCPGDR